MLGVGYGNNVTGSMVLSYVKNAQPLKQSFQF